ncbi:uncharacterized protein AMSG_02843 [Thecamonas trahens ATCC 50062]|uniref:Uncharacterized protein n=1 Tax=Thecamonas trahens ATCC 50062 TaxID=461836 RepID=A0A0L0D2J9_THETB|nr:hypothetical protein AMSG_02843 [Thecamonas trahens ATCC 50062]KNC46390.1 hypothetical protein AMSG_02843 [Thecamonas trahens ATCC 50062]|eukprot:XP_013760683.1 hypothetical protein AMSG_02843 [Thecamonas trahens ATCC 50062]
MSESSEVEEYGAWAAPDADYTTDDEGYVPPAAAFAAPPAPVVVYQPMPSVVDAASAGDAPPAAHESDALLPNGGTKAQKQYKEGCCASCCVVM